MNLQRLLPTLALSLLLGAPALAQGRPGSIYRPDHGPIGMIADKTARRPGDLVTILIREQADVDNQETTNLAKETTHSIESELRSTSVRRTSGAV